MENNKQVQQDNGNLSIYERVRNVPEGRCRDSCTQPRHLQSDIVQLEEQVQWNGSQSGSPPERTRGGEPQAQADALREAQQTEEAPSNSRKKPACDAGRKSHQVA